MFQYWKTIEPFYCHQWYISNGNQQWNYNSISHLYISRLRDVFNCLGIFADIWDLASFDTPPPLFFWGGRNVLTIFLEIVWPLFDRVTTIEYWPSGSRRRVSPSFSSATSKALLRLYRALDFCSFSYWIKSGLKSNTEKNFRMFCSFHILLYIVQLVSIWQCAQMNS